MEFNKAMVVGAGAMGAGIAQLFAQSGIPVTLTDRRSFQAPWPASRSGWPGGWNREK